MTFTTKLGDKVSKWILNTNRWGQTTYSYEMCTVSASMWEKAALLAVSRIAELQNSQQCVSVRGTWQGLRLEQPNLSELLKLIWKGTLPGQAHNEEMLLWMKPKLCRVAGQQWQRNGERARKAQKASCHIVEHYMKTAQEGVLWIEKSDILNT